MSRKPTAVTVMPSIREDVERVLPATIIALTLAAMNELGNWRIRKDMAILVTRVMREHFKGMDALHAGIVADRAAEEATEILKAANEDRVETVWVAASHMVLKLKNDRDIDIPLDLIMVASAIETEIIDRKAPRWGGARHVDNVAHRMENEARRRGWWANAGAPLAARG